MPGRLSTAEMAALAQLCELAVTAMKNANGGCLTLRRSPENHRICQLALAHGTTTNPDSCTPTALSAAYLTIEGQTLAPYLQARLQQVIAEEHQQPPAAEIDYPDPVKVGEIMAQIRHQVRQASPSDLECWAYIPTTYSRLDIEFAQACLTEDLKATWRIMHCYKNTLNQQWSWCIVRANRT